ncbi:mature-parasite-infected erythrocyte surface antigen [Cryptosporidium felis]|nr:mature-parasite-infected erythrocyte surface antigen [Cryptosporidium felis]
MCLRIALILFFFIKLGTLSLSKDANPNKNPLLDGIELVRLGNKQVHSAPKVRLPLPSHKVESSQILISNSDLRLALICSGKNASQIKECENKPLRELDGRSISSVSTFEYDFESDQSENSHLKPRKFTKKADLTGLLEEGIKAIDKNKEIERRKAEERKQIPPDPPKSVGSNGEDSKKTGEKTSFLTGIMLVDDTKKTTKPKEDILGRPLIETSREDSAEPKSPTHQKVTPSPELIDESKDPNVSKDLTVQEGFPNGVPRPQRRVVRLIELEEDSSNRKTDKRTGKQGVFDCFKKPFLAARKGKSNDPKSSTKFSENKKLVKSKKEVSGANHKAVSEAPVPSFPSDSTSTREHQEITSKLGSKKSVYEGLHGHVKENEEYSDIQPVRPEPGSPSELNIPFASKVESDPQISEDITFVSKTPRKTIILPTPKPLPRTITISTPIMDKERTGTRAIDSKGQFPISSPQKDGDLESYPSEIGRTGTRDHSIQPKDYYDDSFNRYKKETLESRVKTPPKKVYEKFTQEKGLEDIIMNKIIDTYNSDDELMERSVLDKLKNKIKKHKNEAKRKKERQKGIPSRVLTKGEIEKHLPDKTKHLVTEIPEKRENEPLSSGIFEEDLPSSTELTIERASEDFKTKTREKGKVEKVIIKKSLNEMRNQLVRDHERKIDPELKTTKIEPIQSAKEVIMYNDELRELKNARDDYFKDKFMAELYEEKNEDKKNDLSTQLSQKEALLQELESISKELDEKIKRSKSTQKKMENKAAYDSNGTQTSIEFENSESSELKKKDQTTETSNDPEDMVREYGESYPEGSLVLDEDVVIMGAERDNENKGIVVLDPENADYEMYFENTEQEDDGLAPVKEYNNEEGLKPIATTGASSEEEGLAPVGGFSKLKELQAFEDKDRSLLPPPEESGLPFEEIHLARHPELLNTDAAGTISKRKAIKKSFLKKEEPKGIFKKRSFEEFNLSKEGIERLKRNPFINQEEKKKILRVIRAKQELENIRKEMRKKQEEDIDDSSLEASELLPIEQTNHDSEVLVRKVTDESLLFGEFEPESEISEKSLIQEKLAPKARLEFSSGSTSDPTTETEGSEYVKEVGIANLNAIKATEQKVEREREDILGPIYFPPYFEKRTSTTSRGKRG